MKNILKLATILLFILVTNLNAGHIIDNANILGPKLSQLESETFSYSVFIESYETLDDIKSFADTKIKSLASKGFIIVVTTHPRKWRISMTPERLVSGEETRIIGDKMMDFFKKGDYYGGLLLASVELNKLVVRAPIESTVVLEKSNEANGGEYIFALLSFAAILVIISYFIYNFIQCHYKNKDKKLQSQFNYFTKNDIPLRRGNYPDSNLVKPSKQSYDFYKWKETDINGKELKEFKNEYMVEFVSGDFASIHSKEQSNLLPMSGVCTNYESSKNEHIPKRYRSHPNSSTSTLRNHSSSNYASPQTDLITPIIVYSALNNQNNQSHHHNNSSDDDSTRKSSSRSTDYSSYDSSSSSDSSSSFSDSSGSSGGDW